MGRHRGRALSVVGERLRAQLLSGPPAPDPVAVAERLLAVQGQDGRGVRLAVRARAAEITVTDVNRALTEDRSLLITWLNRGTLHLVRSEDYPWLHALTTPPLHTPVRARLRQLGVDAAVADRGVAVIEQALADEGPLTRAELKDRLERRRIPTVGQALVHVLCLATLQGVSVRGPVHGKQHAYTLVRDWLGPEPHVERDDALGELVLRYLAGHAPAGERDLAKWAGLPLRDIRRGFERAARSLNERDDGLIELRARGRTRATDGSAELPAPRLLGAFDPVLLGWASREPITGTIDGAIVAGGMFRPFGLVGGRAVARWRIEQRRVRLEPLAPLATRDRTALLSDGEDVVRYLEL
ncbi:MAG TPA: winged helix DNA-binding domain-containing protein [Solirubrobacteraceae bacterium]